MLIMLNLGLKEVWNLLDQWIRYTMLDPLQNNMITANIPPEFYTFSDLLKQRYSVLDISGIRY